MKTVAKPTASGRRAKREPLPENMFDEVLDEVRAIRRGEVQPRLHHVRVPPQVDVRAVRERIGLTQAEFARRYGFSVAAVRKWESQDRQPESAARTLLALIDHDPVAIDGMLEALQGA